MKIKELSLKGFKNLKGDNDYFTINFNNDYNSTVFIGNNGSGKSNVIEAISSIFSALYKKTLNRLPFQFDLYYSIGNNKYRISKKLKVRYRRCLSGNTTYSNISEEVFYSESVHPNAVQLESLPSQIIALYSGEESRLWEKYYKEFYIKYNSEVINNSVNVENDPEMLYINKYHWDIALLTMIASDIELSHIIGDIGINKIIIKINTGNLEKFKKRSFNEVVSFVDNFYFDINGNKLPEDEILIISGEQLKIRLNSETHKRLFNLFCVAKLPKNPDDKLILDLNIEFNNGLTTSDFSEGEKKKILLQLILTILANGNTLVLLDEPDSHIHVAHKKQIKEMIESSNVETILTTHSPSLMNVYENQLIFLDKGRIEGKEKAEILKEISGDLMSYTEQQIVLNSTNDILLVEGKTDEIHIKKALEILSLTDSRFGNLNFEYIPLGGADGLNLFIDKFIPKPSQTIIAFLDRDSAGKDTVKKIFGTNIDLSQYNYRKKNHTYIALYPKKDGSITENFVLEDYYDINLFKNFMMREVSDFTSIPQKDKRKTDFAKYCRDDIDNNIDFSNFKKLFELILLIRTENNGN